MLSKLLKFGGIGLIIAFCVYSSLIHQIGREMTGHEREVAGMPAYASYMEDRFYDMRMRSILDPKKKDPRIVLAAIDDLSLQSVGRWPWTRTRWAEFMRKMSVFGAKIVAFDVFFPEPELACNANSPDDDFALSIEEFQAKQGKSVVIPYSLDLDASEGPMTFEMLPDALYNFIMDSQAAGGFNLRQSKVSKEAWPIDKIINANPLLGHIQAVADVDGVFRHYQVVGNVEDIYFPSFGVSIFEAFTNEKTKLVIQSRDASKLIANNVEFPLYSNGTMKINWLGEKQNFPTVSIKDIFEAKDDNQQMLFALKDNIVFVASTAYGAHDLRHTPVSAQTPGIYTHMNVVNQLLSGRAQQPQAASIKATWITMALCTALIILVQLFGNALIDAVAVILLTAGMYYVDKIYLLPHGYELGMFFCMLSVVACYSWTTFLNFYLASKDKAFLKNAFGTYISPELIDDMYKTGEPPKLGGDCGVRTALFTDIQGFSTFSEQLGATKLVELLNEYLTVMTDILLEEKGTLDKYEGDAIIAFFGAPMPLENHAYHACMVAHRMQTALGELRKKWTSEGDKWPLIVHEMRMRIGLNSGEIVTGNMGSAQRMNYTMMGDAVNLAARLEESAKQYSIFTQIADETVKLAGEEFLFRELDTIRVVGKSVPVTTYDLLGLKKDAPEYLHELASKFKKGIEAYKAQKFDQAIALFTESLELEWQRYPELRGKKTNPSEIYLKRCEEFKKLPPPPEWDGVYTLTSK